MTVAWNPSDKSINVTLSNSNLTATGASGWGGGDALVRADTYRGGGYYFEVTFTADPVGVGIANTIQDLNTYIGADITNAIGYYSSGLVYGLGEGSNFGSYTIGDIIGVALDTGHIRFYKNGVLQRTTDFAPSGNLYPIVEVGNSTSSVTANFGATALSFRPTGYTSWDGTQSDAAGSLNIGVAQTLPGLGQVAAAGAPADRSAEVAQLLAGLGQTAAATVTGTVGGTGVVTTWNPADKNDNIVLSDGNLTAAGAIGWGPDNACVRATETRGSGYYFEVVFTSQPVAVGLANVNADLGNYIGADQTNSVGYFTNGLIYGAGGVNLFREAYSTGDIIGVGVQAGKVLFYKNGTLQYTTNAVPTGSLYPIGEVGNAASSLTANFGASAQAYTPTGFVSWDGTVAVGAGIRVRQTLPALGQEATAIRGIPVTGRGGTVTAPVVVAEPVNPITGLTNSQQLALRALDALQAGQAAPLTAAQISTLAGLGIFVNAQGLTVNAPGATATGGLAKAPILWPRGILPVMSTMFARRTMSTSGGKSLTGVEQVRISSFDRWEGRISTKIRNADQADAFRSIIHSADGRSGIWIVPVCGNNYKPPLVITPPPDDGGGTGAGATQLTFSDGSRFSDSTGFASLSSTGTSTVTVDSTTFLVTGTTASLENVVTAAAIVGARQITINAQKGPPTLGMYMSIGQRLYVVVSLANTSGSIYTLGIRPGLRDPVIANTVVNFDHPICRMRLKDDSVGEMELETLRFATVSLSFVEDF